MSKPTSRRRTVIIVPAALLPAVAYDYILRCTGSARPGGK